MSSYTSSQPPGRLHKDGTRSLTHFARDERSVTFEENQFYHDQRNENLEFAVSYHFKNLPEEAQNRSKHEYKKLQIGNLSSIGLARSLDVRTKDRSSDTLSNGFNARNMASMECFPNDNKSWLNKADGRMLKNATPYTANYQLHHSEYNARTDHHKSNITDHKVGGTRREKAINEKSANLVGILNNGLKKNSLQLNVAEETPKDRVRGRNQKKSRQRTRVTIPSMKSRSRSEPPTHRSTKSEGIVKSCASKTLQNGKNISEQYTDHKIRNHPIALKEHNPQSSKILPTPLKVTSFLSSGDEITQEYVFVNQEADSLMSSVCVNNNKDGRHFYSQETNTHKTENVENRFQKQIYFTSPVDTKKINANSREVVMRPRQGVLKDVAVKKMTLQSYVLDDSKNPLNQQSVANSSELKSRRNLQHSSSRSAPTSPTLDRKIRSESSASSCQEDEKNKKCASVGNSPNVDLRNFKKTPGNPVLHIDNYEKSKKYRVIDHHQTCHKDFEVPHHDPVSASKKGAVLREKNKAAFSNSLKKRPLNYSREAMIDWESQDVENRRRSDTVVNSFRQQWERESFEKPDCDGLNISQLANTSEPLRPTARRAAVVSTLPDSDLSVLSDTIANLQRNQPIALSAHLKRSRWNFPKLNFMSREKDRSREQKLEDVLSSWKSIKSEQTLDVILDDIQNCKRQSSSLNQNLNEFPINGSKQESKRHNAVWELFTSERTYLQDHLLVLLQVFMEPLQKLQCEGFLLSVDVRTLFGNLEELCKVSMEFCHALLNVVGGKRSDEVGDADSIDTAFENFDEIICPPYQRYFAGYRASLADRVELKSNEEYVMFIKWCERNPRCQRLKLNDLLISPMQRLTKFPLLLRNIAENTADKSQNASIERTLAAVQESLKTLEGKVTWLNHFQFLQDLQTSISWPPVYEIDTKTILPESLRNALTYQPCRNLIANPKRRLQLEGCLSVIENGKPIDTYAFLFDDMLLLTRPKKGKRKFSEVPSSLKSHAFLKDGTLLAVYRQPIALDRFMVYDVDEDQASSLGLKKAFVLVQENRFQQMFAVTMLQAPSEDMKRSWLTQLASTAAQWMEKNVYNNEQLSFQGTNTKRLQRTQSSFESYRKVSNKLQTAGLNSYASSSEGALSNNGSESSRRSSYASDTKIEVYSSDTNESV